MWKTKIEEWLHALIPYINIHLDQYDPLELAPAEINFQFKLDMSEKNDLVWLLNPRLNYACTTTDLMVKLRTMIDLLELLEKRGVNVEHYVIRQKEIPETPVYEGPLQTVQLLTTYEGPGWIPPAPIYESPYFGKIPNLTDVYLEDLSQLKPQLTKLGEKELLDMRNSKVKQLNEEYGLSLTEKDIYIVENKLVISAGAEYLIRQAKHQKEMADVFIADADQNALIVWENSLPFKRYVNVLWEGGNEYIVIDNLLIDIQKQRVLAELKTEKERENGRSEFKPTKRKFSKSIRAKLDEKLNGQNQRNADGK